MTMREAPGQLSGVQEYLYSLEWDGQPRLKNWLIFAIAGDPQNLSDTDRTGLQHVGEQFLLDMTSRALQPGCVVGPMLVLVGRQGCGKSRLLKTLAGEFFCDLHWPLNKNHISEPIWIHELCELDSLGRNGLQKLKACLTETQDQYRPSYSKAVVQVPRSHVFAGTTSNLSLLDLGEDPRRLRFVEVTKRISVDHVALMRDQLFAECVARLESHAASKVPA